MRQQWAQLLCGDQSVQGCMPLRVWHLEPDFVHKHKSLSMPPDSMQPLDRYVTHVTHLHTLTLACIGNLSIRFTWHHSNPLCL